MRKLLSCQGERILLQTWPRRIMENYLPEGGAKNHENNGRKGYSQGTKLEPSQGVFPTSSLGTWQYLPRKISELLQTQASDCFPFCNGLFLFVTPTPFYCGTLCVCVWGGGAAGLLFSKYSPLSSLPHLYKLFLTLSTNLGAGHMSCLGQWVWVEAFQCACTIWLDLSAFCVPTLYIKKSLAQEPLFLLPGSQNERLMEHTWTWPTAKCRAASAAWSTYRQNTNVLLLQTTDSFWYTQQKLINTSDKGCQGTEEWL